MLASPANRSIELKTPLRFQGEGGGGDPTKRKVKLRPPVKEPPTRAEKPTYGSKMTYDEVIESAKTGMLPFISKQKEDPVYDIKDPKIIDTKDPNILDYNNEFGTVVKKWEDKPENEVLFRTDGTGDKKTILGRDDPFNTGGTVVRKWQEPESNKGLTDFYNETIARKELQQKFEDFSAQEYIDYLTQSPTRPAIGNRINQRIYENVVSPIEHKMQNFTPIKTLGGAPEKYLQNVLNAVNIGSGALFSPFMVGSTLLGGNKYTRPIQIATDTPFEMAGEIGSKVTQMGLEAGESLGVKLKPETQESLQEFGALVSTLYLPLKVSKGLKSGLRYALKDKPPLVQAEIIKGTNEKIFKDEVNKLTGDGSIVTKIIDFYRKDFKGAVEWLRGTKEQIAKSPENILKIVEAETQRLIKENKIIDPRVEIIPPSIESSNLLPEGKQFNVDAKGNVVQGTKPTGDFTVPEDVKAIERSKENIQQKPIFEEPLPKVDNYARIKDLGVIEDVNLTKDLKIAGTSIQEKRQAFKERVEPKLDKFVEDSKNVDEFIDRIQREYYIGGVRTGEQISKTLVDLGIVRDGALPNKPLNAYEEYFKLKKKKEAELNPEWKEALETPITEADRIQAQNFVNFKRDANLNMNSIEGGIKLETPKIRKGLNDIKKGDFGTEEAKVMTYNIKKAYEKGISGNNERGDFRKPNYMSADELKTLSEPKSETNFADELNKRRENLNKETVHTDLNDLQEGDYAGLEKTNRRAGYEGFVKKVNPKNIIIETSYMGKPMELSFPKSEVSKFYKPKEKPVSPEVTSKIKAVSYAEAKNLIKKEGGFANMKSLEANNAYAGEQLAGSAGLNAKYIYEKSIEKGIQLRDYLQRYDAETNINKKQDIINELFDKFDEKLKSEKPVEKVQQNVGAKLVPEKPDQTYYHGSDFRIGKPQSEFKTKLQIDAGIKDKLGFSVTTDKKIAKTYGENVYEYNILPDSKIATPKDLPEVKFTKHENGEILYNQIDAIKLAKEKGFDGVNLAEFEKLTTSPNKNKEIQIFNSDILTPKSTLEKPLQGDKTLSEKPINEIRQEFLDSKNIKDTNKLTQNEKAKLETEFAKWYDREYPNVKKIDVFDELVNKFETDEKFYNTPDKEIQKKFIEAKQKLEQAEKEGVNKETIKDLKDVRDFWDDWIYRRRERVKFLDRPLEDTYTEIVNDLGTAIESIGDSLLKGEKLQPEVVEGLSDYVNKILESGKDVSKLARDIQKNYLDVGASANIIKNISKGIEYVQDKFANRIKYNKTIVKPKTLSKKPVEKTPEQRLTDYETAKGKIGNAIINKTSLKFDKLDKIPNKELLNAVYDVAKYHIENGITKFGDFARQMVKDTGDWIKPHLRRLWDESKKWATSEHAYAGSKGLGESLNSTLPAPKTPRKISVTRDIPKADDGFTAKQRIVYEMANPYEPFARYSKESKVAKTWQDPTIQAFNTMNTNSTIAKWIEGDRTPMLMANGEFLNPKGSVKHLAKMIKGKERAFDEFLVARRVIEDYKQLEKLEGKEKQAKLDQIQKDNFDIKDAERIIKEREKQFTGATNLYDALNKRLLFTAKETGLITLEQFNKYSSEKGYASFQRLIGELGDVGTVSTNPATKLQAMKQRTGSDLEIVSPTYNQIKSIKETISKGNENLLWNKVYELSLKNEKLKELFKEVKEEGQDTIKFRIDGKERIFEAPPEFIQVMKTMRPKEMQLAARILRLPANIFTRLVTSAFPPFALTNFPIDQIAYAMQTKTKGKPLFDAGKNIVEFITNGFKLSELSQKYQDIGGKRQTMASYLQLTPDQVTKKLTGRTKMDKVERGVDAVLGVLEMPSNISEMITRFSEFQRAKKMGKNDSEALYMASEVTVPFQLQGNLGGRIGREIIKSIPYFNASIQVAYKFLRTAKEQPGRVAVVASAVIASGITSALLTFENGTEKQKRLLSNQPVKELTKAIFIPSPDGNSLIRIRVPDQIGALTGIAYLYIISQYNGNKAGFKEYYDAGTSVIPDQFNPFQPDKMFLGLRPQILKPTWEVIQNQRTYPEVAPIVPDHLKVLKPEMQYTEYTSEVGKFIGQILNASPMLVDHWLKGQFGQIGNLLTHLPRSVTDPNIPIIRQEERFIMSGRSYNNFYDEKTLIEQNFNSAKTNDMDDAQKKDVAKQMVVYDRVSNILSDLRKVLRKNKDLPEDIRNDTYKLLLDINNMATTDEVITKAEKLRERTDAILKENNIEVKKSKFVKEDFNEYLNRKLKILGVEEE